MKQTTKDFCSARFSFGAVCLPMFLTLLLALASSAFAQEQAYGDITIAIEALHAGGRYSTPNNGYAEFRATATNNSASQTHRVEIQLRSYSENSSTRRSTELAPKATASFSLFLLPTSEETANASLIIDGVRQTPAVEISQLKTLGGRSGSMEVFDLLLSPSIFKSDLPATIRLESVLQTSSGAVLLSTQTYDSPLTDWSANWLSYSRFNGIVIYASELDEAPDAVRSALLHFVECGGTLLVVGNWQPPQSWLARQGLLKDDGLTAEETKADKDNDATKVMLPLASMRRDRIKDRPLFYVGFGTVVVVSELDPMQIGINQWKRLRWIFHASKIPSNRYESLADFNQAFQVVERFGVPVRGLFALMLAFVILIGPVNLFWLARRKRKIWMLWTVPLIALLTCLAIAAFSLFGEGWNATARTESLTLLDETAHRATTIGWAGFYSPITPSDGLHFSYDTELRPQLWGWVVNGRRNNSDAVVDWTNDQHLASGWIAARVPAFFRLRKSEVRRERLSIRQEANGAVTLVNGLGAPISGVWWADDNGNIFAATNIAAGAQATLTPAGTQAIGHSSSLRESFSQDWLMQFKSIPEQPQTLLMPKTYLAVLDDSPFVEQALKSVTTRKARSLVYGIR